MGYYVFKNLNKIQMYLLDKIDKKKGQILIEGLKDPQSAASGQYLVVYQLFKDRYENMDVLKLYQSLQQQVEPKRPTNEKKFKVSEVISQFTASLRQLLATQNYVPFKNPQDASILA